MSPILLSDARHAPFFRGGANVTLGECFLAVGLTGLAVGTGLVQFPIIGLVGVATAPVAVAVLLAAGLLVRGPGIPAARATFGLILFLGGVILLFVTSLEVTGRAYEFVRGVPLDPAVSPTAPAWPLVAYGAPVAALALALGLRLRAGWSAPRLLVWALAALSVCPAALSLFLALVPFLPLDV